MDPLLTFLTGFPVARAQVPGSNAPTIATSLTNPQTKLPLPDTEEDEEDVARPLVDWHQVWRDAMTAEGLHPAPAAGTEEEEEFHDAEEKGGFAPPNSPVSPVIAPTATCRPLAKAVGKGIAGDSVGPQQALRTASESSSRDGEDYGSESEWEVLRESEADEPWEIIDGEKVEDDWDFIPEADRFRRGNAGAGKSWNARMREFFEQEGERRESEGSSKVVR